MPEVSVILPAYRAAAHIAAALDSVYAQTFSCFEVIVVNDGSPDTAALVGVLAPYAPRLQYLHLPVNRGPAVARNAGIAAARGRYVAFLDADDRWSPVLLQTQVAYLESHLSCDLVFADADRANGVRSTSRRPGDEAARGPITLLSLVQQSCKIALPTVVVRRETILTAGLFDEGLRRGQDFDLWLRLALRGTVMEHQHLTLVERHPSPESSSGDAVAELERALSVLERFGHRHLLDATTRTALRIRTMQLIDRLEIEQGKLRTAATRERPLRLRLARVALQIAPRLVRAIYARVCAGHRLMPSSAANDGHRSRSRRGGASHGLAHEQPDHAVPRGAAAGAALGGPDSGSTAPHGPHDRRALAQRTMYVDQDARPGARNRSTPLS